VVSGGDTSWPTLGGVQVSFALMAKKSKKRPYRLPTSILLNTVLVGLEP
jgi:hypothetical protein